MYITIYLQHTLKKLYINFGILPLPKNLTLPIYGLFIKYIGSNWTLSAVSVTTNYEWTLYNHYVCTHLGRYFVLWIVSWIVESYILIMRFKMLMDVDNFYLMFAISLKNKTIFSM